MQLPPMWSDGPYTIQGLIMQLGCGHVCINIAYLTRASGQVRLPHEGWTSVRDCFLGVNETASLFFQ